MSVNVDDLHDSDKVEAFNLYDYAIRFIALGSVFPNRVQEAVAQKLEFEMLRADEEEKPVFKAMIDYLRKMQDENLPK